MLTRAEKLEAPLVSQCLGAYQEAKLNCWLVVIIATYYILASDQSSPTATTVGANTDF